MTETAQNIDSMQGMDQARFRFRSAIDEKAKSLELTQRDDMTKKFKLTYASLGPDLTIQGTLYGDRIRARLHRMPDAEFPLLTRGFHWINEYPRNR